MKEGAPLCFILMPFGRKANADGTLIDFDRVYAELIAPAVAGAGLEPLRADEELSGGIIHKAMFERLILCPFAVADLTLANANVFYELGVRHAFRPWSTIQIVAEGGRLPFDVQMLRTIPYRLTADGALDVARVAATQKTIADFLTAARQGAKDSPIFQLLDNIREPSLDHVKTDVFREQVEYSERVKEKLAAARKSGADSVRDVEKQLGTVADLDSGIAVDLLLSYRAAKAWSDMVDLAGKLAPPLASTVLVREQLGFALNRLGHRDEAERVLRRLIEERGPSSETCGILGRVYKDLWDEARQKGDAVLADGYLVQAIEMYLAGFEADWRDAYPGINAVTLMELQEPPDEQRLQVLPAVRYAVERKIAKGKPDYWDYATLLELAVLAMDQAGAAKALARAAALVREPWEPETTARNLKLIREARERRGVVPGWLKGIEDVLQLRAAPPGKMA